MNEIVLSVPAGQTYELIKKHLIYAYPNDRRYQKLDRFIAFRQAHGGKMDFIFAIKASYTIDLSNWEGEINEPDCPSDVVDRLRGYIMEREKSFGFQKTVPFIFFVLSPVCPLEHGPRPKKNTPGARYYRFGDLTNGEVYP